MTGVVVTALAAGIGVAATVTYARLVRLRAADTCVIAASAALLPVVAWRSPGEYGRVLAGALLMAALVPALGGTTRLRRAAGGALGVACLAALML